VVGSRNLPDLLLSSLVEDGDPKNGLLSLGTDALLGRIFYLRREHDRALAELAIALELNPSYAWAHYGVGAALVFSGHAEEGVPHLERAIRLSPRDPYMGSFLLRMADAYLLTGDYEKSVEWARKALLQPGTPVSYGLRAMSGAITSALS
jgi:tetratricopeptide (TPR) repeat protein